MMLPGGASGCASSTATGWLPTFPRTRALGIVVVENPTHYLNPALDPAHAVPGGIRAPFRSLLAAGIPLAFGSDGPANPGLNILAAITLADKRERLTREQAVRAYTAGAAYAEFAEQQKGTLAPGKLADLAVLSQDIFTVPAAALPGTVSVLTMVGGRVVYEAKQPVPTTGAAKPGAPAYSTTKRPTGCPAWLRTR